MLPVAEVYSSIVLTVSFPPPLSAVFSLLMHTFRWVSVVFRGVLVGRKWTISWNPGTSLSQEICTARTSVLPVETGPVPSASNAALPTPIFTVIGNDYFWSCYTNLVSKCQARYTLLCFSPTVGMTAPIAIALELP